MGNQDLVLQPVLTVPAAAASCNTYTLKSIRVTLLSALVAHPGVRACSPGPSLLKQNQPGRSEDQTLPGQNSLGAS